MATNDADILDTENTAGADADSDSGDLASQLELMKSKFNGQTSKVGKLEAKLTALQKRYDTLAGDSEQQQSELRRSKNAVETATKDLQAKFDAAESERAKLAIEVARFNDRTADVKLISDKFPDKAASMIALHTSGNLKTRSDFAGDDGPAKYEQYLTEMASFIAPVASATPATPPPPPPADALSTQVPEDFFSIRRQQLSGSVPNSPAPVTPGGKGTVRTPEGIADEMRQLDRRIPEQNAKFNQLVAEQDALLG